MKEDGKTRCAWADANDLLASYHDEEWGVPVHDDRLLFEMLNLEGAQAGLSWLTILMRRDGYRRAFDNFDAEEITRYDDDKRAALLQDQGIIRNRLKVGAVIENAKACLATRQHGSLDAYLWSFVHGKQLTPGDRPLAVAASRHMSTDLKKKGFRFVGPTTCYSFMQAVGMINDHSAECFRYGELDASTSSVPMRP
jgi:DNA-3-methyladenine glycosylase I